MVKSKCYRRLIVKDVTFELVHDCIEVFLKHHPEFEHIPITQNKIIFEMAKFYMKNE